MRTLILSVSALLLVSAMMMMVVVVVSAAEQDPLLVQHSLDGGATWLNRGTLDPVSLEFEPAASVAWEPAQLQQLRALATKKGQASVSQTSVLVRVRDQKKEGDVHASIAVSPCALIVPRQYTTALTYIAERYGVTVQKVAGGAVRVNSLRLLNPFHDEVCEPTVFFKSGSSSSSSGGAPVKLKMSFVRSPLLKGMSLPYSAAADEANLHDGAKARMRREEGAAAGGGGGGGGDGEKAGGPEKEQTLWEKYGSYVWIFMVIQLVSTFLAPKDKGGEEGAEGAPAVAGPKGKK